MTLSRPVTTVVWPAILFTANWKRSTKGRVVDVNEQADRTVAAPELAEVAQIWWDVDRAPEVHWDEDATAFDLVDPEDHGRRLVLLRLIGPPADARLVADVLAEGLAACDFPPTGVRASPARVEATLRAAGLDLPPRRAEGA